MRVCARVLAAALMTGVIGAALSLPALLSTGGGEHGALHAPPSAQQRTLRLPELNAPAQHRQQHKQHVNTHGVVRHPGASSLATTRVARRSNTTSFLASNRIATAPRVTPAPITTPAPRPTEPVTPPPPPPPAPPAEAAPPPTRELASTPPPVVEPVTPPPADDEDEGDDDGDNGCDDGGGDNHGQGHAYGHDKQDSHAAADSSDADHGNGNGNGNGKGHDK
jgi:hypothetical protein